MDRRRSEIGVLGASMSAAKRSKAQPHNDYLKIVASLQRIAALLERRLKERENERRR